MGFAGDYKGKKELDKSWIWKKGEENQFVAGYKGSVYKDNSEIGHGAR